MVVMLLVIMMMMLQLLTVDLTLASELRTVWRLTQRSSSHQRITIHSNLAPDALVLVKVIDFLCRRMTQSFSHRGLILSNSGKTDVVIPLSYSRVVCNGPASDFETASI